MPKLEKISILLLGVAGVIATIIMIYIFRIPPAENTHTTLLLTSGAIGLALVFISFVLGDLSRGEKTVKEAIATVAAEMAMLALFILIATLLRK